ncbi:FMN-binding protein [bacterium]|nr:FMN-binding protein [bacterium]
MSTPLKERGWFSIVFMFSLTAIASAILIMLAGLTRQRVDANQKLSFERSVLEAVGETVPKGASGIEVNKIYNLRVKDTVVAKDTFLVYHASDSTLSYIIPLSGAGFWDKISGVIALAPDRRTVIGISFYQQNETPGLGGEIMKPYFKNQFKGKKLAESGIPIELRPVGAPLDSSSVEAITGATQTSTRLMKFVNARLDAWRRSAK